MLTSVFSGSLRTGRFTFIVWMATTGFFGWFTWMYYVRMCTCVGSLVCKRTSGALALE